jgi:AmmeMemoRadiSam system protein B
MVKPTEPTVRDPEVSGTFYPSEEKELRNTIMHFLNEVHTDIDFKKIIGVVVPHAGYVYSGRTAAYSYSILKNSSVKKFIIVGPNHNTFPFYAAVSTTGYWRTPLGDARIDESLAKSIVSKGDIFGDDPTAHESEHSIEVQIPFLQYIFGDTFSFVPIILGEQEEKIASSVSKALEPYLDDAILIASSDLTHYEAKSVAEAKDSKLIDDVLSLNTHKFYETLKSKKISACGYGAIAILMELTKSLGGKIKLLNYSTSYDYSKDDSFVVGYSSFVSYL